MAPVPEDEKVYLSGLARTSATNSRALLAGKSGSPPARRRQRDQAHRREILERVVRDLLQVRHDRDRPARSGEQRVAVRRALHHHVGADRAAGARAVVDYERLAERLLQLAPPPRALRCQSPVPAATARPPAPVGWDRPATRRCQQRARTAGRRWLSLGGFPPRAILKRARVRAAVDQQVLAGDVTRLRAAEIGAGVAELGADRRARPAGWSAVGLPPPAPR